MSDFLDGLERDLVEAMRRHESRPSLWRRLLEGLRLSWPRGLAMAAIVAAAVLVAAVVRSLPGTDREMPATPPGLSIVLPDGEYVGDSHHLLLTDGRYTLVRCRGRDCAFDVFDGGAGRGTKLLLGAVALRGGQVFFSKDASCLEGGLDAGGTYRVRRSSGQLRLQLVRDSCRERVQALTGSAFERSP